MESIHTIQGRWPWGYGTSQHRGGGAGKELSSAAAAAAAAGCLLFRTNQPAVCYGRVFTTALLCSRA